MELLRADIEALGALLNARAGLKLAADGEFGLALAMKGRMQALSLAHSSAYLAYVRGPDQDSELHRLLPLVTIGKTDFFRDEKQFAALTSKLMPEALARARSERRSLKIWSAACATGEEPYSLAICCVEAGALVSEVNLRATDINGEAVFEAERGVYSLRQLRPVSSERVRRFFIAEGRDAAKVTSEVRRMVRFEVGNLAELSPDLPGGHDLIFCRNVMIYFDAATMVRTLDRFYELLLPGGYLALGYSESLYRVYSRFELTEVDGAFFYRKPLGERRPTPAPVRPPTPPMMTRIGPGQPRVTASFPRVTAEPPARPRTALLPPKVAPAPVPPPAIDLVPQAPHRLARSAELIERGQFLEALDLLRSLCQSEPTSLIGWVSMGNLLTVLRRFPEAFAAYERALQVEPLSAEARLFSGVALVEANRPREAMEELGRALFLDGELALAHYYLGRAAEASGDGAAARRAYKNCLAICQSGRPGRPYVAHYPDLPKDPEVLGRASQYALSAVR